jgi:hypothetical protein
MSTNRALSQSGWIHPIEFADSLEALANLLYLIRKSIDDSPKASIYVDLAEARIKAIAIQFGVGIPLQSSYPSFG